VLRSHERLTRGAVSVFLAATFSLQLCSSAFSQTTGSAPGGRPGSSTGAVLPGMPPPNTATTHTGTARIRGRVVAQTGAPLRRAQVQGFAAEGQVRRTTTTDADGRYEFADLPPGRFIVSVTKAGYVTLQYGQRRTFEAGTPITVGEGQQIDRIDFSLPRGAVISVRITDDFGDPIAGAQVQVQRYQYAPDGQRRLTPVQSGGSFGISTTDDRGELRAFGLMPGEYIVSAIHRSGPALPLPNSTDTSEGFAPTFYPGTINLAEAQAISVTAGDETPVQFSMVAARLARVSGTVVDSNGRPAIGAILQLLTRQGTGGFGMGAGSVSTDGTFTIAGVAPGEHSIEVRPIPRPGATGGEFASVPIVVSGADLAGVRVVTGKGALVTGRVVFEGTSPRIPIGGGALRIFPQPADTSRPFLGFGGGDPLTNGTLDDAGGFQYTGASGRVFFTVSAPPPWVLKSVTLDGEDVTDEPIDLTGKQSVSGLVIRMTDRVTQVSGQVTDARGQTVRDYVVVLLPVEAKPEPVVAGRWIRTARPDSNGRFQTRVRPGRYVATAIEDLEQGRQFAPELQEQLRRSGRELSVREGETLTVDLKLTSGL
jgi:protocatechuate 3,4-dioxygenase beta subunit